MDVIRFLIGSSLATTQNVEIRQAATLKGGSLLVQTRTVGFSGTIGFRGQIDSSLISFNDLPFIELTGIADYELIDAASFTTETAVRLFLVPLLLPLTEVQVTRSAGNVTLWGAAGPQIQQLPIIGATV